MKADKLRSVLGFLGMVFITLVIFVLVLLPFWLYLVARALFDPEGFWQEIALFGIWCVIGGWIQVITLIFGITLIADVWE